MIGWIVGTGVICILYTEFVGWRMHRETNRVLDELQTKMIGPLAREVVRLQEQVAALQKR